MIKRTFLLLAVTALIFHPADAQGPQLVNVTPPSPNVQAMQKYGDIPVSAYTGVPDISVPIYTAQYRDLSIPISLSYHASGIKVAEEASQVGLGWVLNAGGEISRNIIGGDDFVGGNYFDPSIMDIDSGQGPQNKVQLGCVLQMFNTTSTGNTTYTHDFTQAISDLKEFQPDQYYYNFPGHSGKFVMTRTFEAILQKQEPIQITCQTPAGDSWEVKSEDGYIYDFALQETYVNPGATSPHICAWYLTKITSPTGNIATFNYTANPTTTQGLGTYSEIRDDYQFTTAPGMQGSAVQTYQYGATASPIYSTQLLTSIDMPNCRVQFYYSGNRQDLTGDQKLDSVSVFVKNKSVVATQPLKTTVLAYSYFNYPDADDYAFAGNGSTGTIYSERLKLTQVQDFGYNGGNVLSLPPYVFSYYEGDNNHTMPSKGSFARDHWGYFNGKFGRHTLIPSTLSVTSDYEIAFALGIQGPDRDADSNFISAFSLKSIQYPTGGLTQFQYQANDFDEYNSEVNDNTYFAQTPAVVPATFSYDYDVYDHRNNTSDTLDLTNQYIGSLNTYGLISVNASFRFASSGDCNWTPAPEHAMYWAIYDTLGNGIQQFDLADYVACSGANTTGCYICGGGVFSIKQTFTLPSGIYILKGFNAGTELDSLESIQVNFSWSKINTSKPGSGTTVSQNDTYYSVGGGQRILRIIDENLTDPTSNKVRKYVYHYWADKIGAGTPQEYSFGRRMTKPEYAYFSDDFDNYSSSQPAGCQVTPQYYTVHLLRGSDSNNPLNGSAAGAVVGYDQVSELFGENGEYGEKVYRYNNQPDVAFSYIEPLSGLSLPIRPPYGSTIPNALNGTLIEETDYANTAGSFYKIKDISNTYQTVRSSENNVYGLLNNRTNNVNLGDQCAVTTSQICDPNSMTLTYLSMPSEWQQLVSTEQKDYNQGDTAIFLDTYTNFYYDNVLHKQVTRTVTTNSKGEKVTAATHYALDFPSPTDSDAFSLGIARLQQSHVINTPVEKHIDKINADGSNPRTVNAYLTWFNSTTPTVSAVYRLENATPVTGFTPASVSSSGLSSNALYQPYLYFDQYDANGNILQQHKVSDLSHSYIWDYAGALLVAEVTNASQSDIAYTSFESDGTGNWTLASAITDGTTAITGNQSYNLANGNISKTGLQQGNSYVVSYWSKNGSYTITGASGTLKTGSSINGWTYYEHVVTASSSTITIGGTGNIDELRLYPSSAQMVTYTYSPLVGVSSRCDAGSRITYYDYDGLGRLQDIKDQNGNILKTYDYQLQLQ